MKPIKYKLKKECNIIKNESEFIDDDWEEKEFYTYQPEWFEEIYDGANKHQLATHNHELQYYMNHKDEYTYIGTWNHNKSFVEYYYIDDNTIIGFYSESRLLHAVMVWINKKIVN